VRAEAAELRARLVTESVAICDTAVEHESFSVCGIVGDGAGYGTCTRKDEVGRLEAWEKALLGYRVRMRSRGREERDGG
jgi:hypothetical protein